MVFERVDWHPDGGCAGFRISAGVIIMKYEALYESSVAESARAR